MASLFTIVTDDGMTFFSDVAGLVAVMIGTRLSLIVKMHKDFGKMQETRDRLFYLNLVMTYTIFDILPAWETEHTSAVRHNITKL